MKINQTSHTLDTFHTNTVCVLFLFVTEPNMIRSNNAFLKITLAFFARRLNVLSLVPISGLSDKLLLSFYPSFHFCWFQLLPVPLASTIQVSNNLSEITQISLQFHLGSLRTKLFLEQFNSYSQCMTTLQFLSYLLIPVVVVPFDKDNPSLKEKERSKSAT